MKILLDFIKLFTLNTYITLIIHWDFFGHFNNKTINKLSCLTLSLLLPYSLTLYSTSVAINRRELMKKEWKKSWNEIKINKELFCNLYLLRATWCEWKRNVDRNSRKFIFNLILFLHPPKLFFLFMKWIFCAII